MLVGCQALVKHQAFVRAIEDEGGNIHIIALAVRFFDCVTAAHHTRRRCEWSAACIAKDFTRFHNGFFANNTLAPSFLNLAAAICYLPKAVRDG